MDGIPFALIIGSVAAVLIATVVADIVVRRRRIEARGVSTALPHIVAALCLVGVVLAIVGGLVGIVQSLAPGTVLLQVPVFTEVEKLPQELRADPQASINGGSQQQNLLLGVSGLDTPARIWAATACLFTSVVAATLLAMTARLAQQSIADAPFSPRLGRMLIIGGTVLAVGGTAAHAASTVAGRLAHEQLFRIREDYAPDLVYVPPGWVIELWPIAVGLVLIVIARLIRNGERLQRDTAGLV